MLRAGSGPKVLEVNSSPGFEGIEGASGKNVAGALWDAIERHVRPTPARRPRRKAA
jgi:ribosomal protein S6--L-glutamate ligase